jgi:hypothetical protein
MASRSELIDGIDDRHLRLEYMGGRCIICHKTIEETERRLFTSKGAFQFNHIDPSKKSPIYENLIRRVISQEQLDELDKCNLLCGFCHPIWTNQRLTGEINITRTLPNGRVVEMRSSFHAFAEMDGETPHFYLFADEPRNPDIYEFALGRKKRESRLGFELEQELVKLLLETRERRTLRVWDQQGVAFEAKRVDASCVRFRFAVRFPLFKFEGRTDNPARPHLWVRNGKMLIKGLGVRTNGEVRGKIAYAELEKAVAAAAALREKSA